MRIMAFSLSKIKNNKIVKLDKEQYLDLKNGSDIITTLRSNGFLKNDYSEPLFKKNDYSFLIMI